MQDRVNTSSPMDGPAVPLVSMQHIGKRYGDVSVLDDVLFDILPGEVHVLAGENGAGKSTLMKILGGVCRDYVGTVKVSGALARFRSPLEANAAGITVIYQELSLVPSLSVADNIFLGRNKTRGGFIRDRSQRNEAYALLARLGLHDIDVEETVENLSIAQQQMVEIAKGLALEARVVVMDEPTSALNAPEVETLFKLIATLKERGCGIVYISHKMAEIERIADRITVLRDGRHIGTKPARDLPIPKLVEWMVGRELNEDFPRHVGHTGEVCLAVSDFTVKPAGARDKANGVSGVSFDIRRGEILGIAGLQGSGSSELLLGLFGAYGAKRVSGNVMLAAKTHKPRAPADSIRRGIALLTNDRKATGLVLSLPILANATLAALNKASPTTWRSAAAERAMVEPIATSLRLKAVSLDQDIDALSGGNQQKVVLAKWLATQPQILLLDEPTRGIDVGAKREIYQLMTEWTARGVSILLITSELPELLAMSDRIIVLHRGRIAGEFTARDATPQRVLAAAMGESVEHHSRRAVG